MGKALIRFYEELNDFLPPGKRKRDFELPLKGKETLRAILERLGVPQALVDLLLVNGRSAALADVVEDGDRISVYPVFERFNIRGVSRVRPKPLRRLCFVVDRDLGELAPFLRSLGLDACVNEGLEREEVRPADRRILLTLRRDVPGFSQCDRVIILRPGSLKEQAYQVIEALDLRIGLSQQSQHGKERQREASAGFGLASPQMPCAAARGASLK